MVKTMLPFDVNQTEFINDYQREVWKLGIHIVPLDVSLADIADPETREGCTQVYQCTMDILKDMFKNTEDYKITRPPDYILFAFAWATGKQRVPAGIKKRKGLYEYIYGRLERFGFTFDSENLINERYPLFMRYWLLLQERGAQTLFCDFRPLAPNYKWARTRDDLLRPLSDQDKLYAAELYDYALTKGAKRLSYNQYKPYCFVYRKKHVLVLYNNDGIFAAVPYMNQYTAGDAVGELQQFIAIAKQQPDSAELIAYIQQGITCCRSCDNANCNGRIVDVAGVKRHLAYCHTEISKAHRSENERVYTDYDISMLKRMIDVRFLQVENQNEGAK